MKNRIAKNWALCLVIVFFAVSITYICVKGDSIYITIHDYLDSHPAWMKMVKDNDLFWKDGTLPFLNGIDRDYLYSELHVYTWLFMILPVFPAIVTGWYLGIAMSICGFIFLFSTMFGKKEYDLNIPIFTGLLYGILPIYPPTVFAFMSLPILLALLIRIRRKADFLTFLGLFLYPSLSDFVMFGTFILGYLILYSLLDAIINREINARLFVSFLGMSIGYMIFEYRLFGIMLFSNEKTIRSSFDNNYLAIGVAAKEGLNVFINSYYHCGSLHAYIVLPVIFIYLLLKISELYKKRAFRLLLQDRILWIVGLIVLNCIIYSLDHTKTFRLMIAKVIPPLEGYAFDRAIWMNAFLWYLAFSLVLVQCGSTIVKVVISLLAGAVIVLKPATYNLINLNLMPIGYRLIKGEEYTGLNYREFYSPELFEKIKDEISYEGEWSIAFGMHPAILEYNEIATIDGYLSYYPASYEKQFRKLIAPDFDVDEKHRDYFNEFCGRAYIYSNEIEYEPDRIMSSDSANMLVDMDVFDEMGGKYVFSRVQILNEKELGITQVGEYSGSESPYTIYVYKR